MLPLLHLEITKAIPNISWFISMMGDLEMLTVGYPALKTKVG
jgi:hypothetical protein